MTLQASLLGVAYLESYLGANDDMNASLVRLPFKECVDKITTDLNRHRNSAHGL